MVRIFAACHGTQLMVIQHLRQYLRLPKATEFLIWHPFENGPSVDAFMQAVISTGGFTGTLDIRNFESLRPRTQGFVRWWFESTRRLRRDAATLRRWMQVNRIAEDDVELWADDPIHFYVSFSRGVLRNARHVKIPHGFNHEDGASSEWKAGLEDQWRAISPLKTFLFLPWQRWTSGVDMRMERLVYDRAYSFDKPSPWALRSEDLSHTISLDAFDKTYRSLAPSVRAEVDAVLEPIRSGRRPLAVLLLFGLGTGPEPRRVYERSIARIFSEHSSELKGCTLAVKVHPGANGVEERALIDWLTANVDAQVYPIAHRLNLEFMLPRLRPDYVMAGPCGALPIVKRLGIGRPIALSEVTNDFLQSNPHYQTSVDAVLDGIETW